MTVSMQCDGHGEGGCGENVSGGGWGGKYGKLKSDQMKLIMV